jgi:hypothetical protein
VVWNSSFGRMMPIPHSIDVRFVIVFNTTPVLYILPFLTTPVAIFGPVSY